MGPKTSRRTVRGVSTTLAAVPAPPRRSPESTGSPSTTSVVIPSRSLPEARTRLLPTESNPAPAVPGSAGSPSPPPRVGASRGGGGRGRSGSIRTGLMTDKLAARRPRRPADAGAVHDAVAAGGATGGEGLRWYAADPPSGSGGPAPSRPHPIPARSLAPAKSPARTMVILSMSRCRRMAAFTSSTVSARTFSSSSPANWKVRSKYRFDES